MSGNEDKTPQSKEAFLASVANKLIDIIHTLVEDLTELQTEIRTEIPEEYFKQNLGTKRRNSLGRDAHEHPPKHFKQ